MVKIGELNTDTDNLVKAHNLQGIDVSAVESPDDESKPLADTILPNLTPTPNLILRWQKSEVLLKNKMLFPYFVRNNKVKHICTNKPS